ncbi:acetyl esterase/lipase [Paraburkholderia tropica]|uniref:alpha/beta hydrolase n=1 Tax=Paraburkholderia tropica TaxID=92647 RepID=UPI001612853A|nr:alpha/beta hydrolase [Paraburkholderia tropica]MBB3003954.1 acetyl esterase/lipase [Paraburkholderia tropica]MBB6323452.1 acetyl esterase/lipase [Paraburkholderia tropica]
MVLNSIADYFKPDAVSQDTIAINQRLKKMLAGSAKRADLAAARDAYASGELGIPVGPRSTRALTRVIPGPRGEIELRILIPKVVRGAYLYIHGGGWMMGSNDLSDDQLELIGQRAALVTVSVQYRLAPEEPFPAPVDDCVAAARWLIANVESEFGVSWLAIGGESAGAHLTAATLLRLRDEGLGNAYRAASLMYGCFDLSLTPSLRRAAPDTPFVDTASVAAMVDAFRSNVDSRDPAISPLYADLCGLPPALFSVGTADSLVDDTLFMNMRWQAAGNDAQLAIYPGGVHGFNFLGGELASSANEKVADFLDQLNLANAGHRAIDPKQPLICND